MLKVKGLYNAKSIRFLRKVDPGEKVKKSLQSQLETMKNGFDMGGILAKYREELHER